MSRSLLVLLVAVLLTGCDLALPSNAQYPGPVASAAQPGVAAAGDLPYAHRGLEAMRNALRDLEPDEALARVPAEGLHLENAKVNAACVAAPGALPVLVCHFGPLAAQPVAQGIFWHDDGGWHAQLYPQAPRPLTAERLAWFEQHGCRLGCRSGVSRVRQGGSGLGPELLVVMNLGLLGPQRAEEAQLLRLVDDEWRVAWVPGEGDWYYGHAEVRLPARGFATFQVRNSSLSRQDRLTGYLSESASDEFRRFTERWEKKGAAYVMRDKAEEPSPFGALVRLIDYLSTGADEKAGPLLRPGISLEEARKALAQKPLRQGWPVVRWGESGFLLDTAKTGKPTVGVRFERHGDGWALAEVKRVQGQ